MKLLDERGRLLGRVNVIDLAAVVLVLFVVAAAVYKVAVLNRRVVGETRPVQLLLEVTQVRDYTTRMVKPGDFVLEHNSSLPVGTIAAVRVEPAREPVQTADGRVVLAEVPERFDMLLTVDGTAVVTDQAITVGGQQVRIGAELRIKTRMYLLLSKVVGIEIRD